MLLKRPYREERARKSIELLREQRAKELEERARIHAATTGNVAERVEARPEGREAERPFSGLEVPKADGDGPEEQPGVP